MKASFLLGLVPIVAITSVLAADAPRPPISDRASTGDSTVTVIRVIDGNAADAAQWPAQTVSFQIPEFRSQQSAERRYYVVHFTGPNSRVAGGAVSPEGVLTASFQQIPDFGQPRAPASPAQSEPETEQYSWFYSVHRDTGQLLITLDLADVPLAPLVNSLAMALAKTNGEQLLAPPGLPAGRSNMRAEEIRLKIRGNHMTLRETLDLIHQQTGCSVFREQGRLLTTVCE